MEIENPLWHLLKGETEKRRKKHSISHNESGVNVLGRMFIRYLNKWPTECTIHRMLQRSLSAVLRFAFLHHRYISSYIESQIIYHRNVSPL